MVEAVAASLGFIEDVVADGALEVLVFCVGTDQVLDVDDLLIIHYNF